MSFIYKIINDINDKIYIGKTNLSIEERFKQHLRDASKRQLENRPLYRAINKYGAKHFFIQEIEECESKEASNREIFWISYYNSYNYGYNATKGGDGKNFYDHEKIIARLKEHPYPKEVAEEFHCSPDLVRDLAKSAKIEVKHRGRENNVNSKKQVAQYTKDNQYIQSFESTASAARWCFENGLCSSLSSGVRTHIGEVCNGKRKTAYSFIWKYE